MNNIEKKIFKSLSCFLLVLAATLIVGSGSLNAQSSPPAVHEEQEHESAAGESSQQWTCSMHPQIILPNPGKCPICAMDLIPLKQESTGGAGSARGLREIKLSPYAQKLAEIEVAPVERKFVSAEIRMVGKVAYDETRQAHISAWVPGRIDKMYVDFTGTEVRRGDPMVSLYSPDLLTAQQELIQATKTAEDLKRSSLTSMKGTVEATVGASREKLRLWGLNVQQIDAILKQGKPSDHMTITAPISGVVVMKRVAEGAYVQMGTQIYTMADLSRVWVKLDAYESDLMWIEEGQEVEFETEAYPGEFFKGTVDFIDPFLNPKTRTVKVRLNAPNAKGKLKPDMFVSATLHAVLGENGILVGADRSKTAPPLVIPASAPLITGKRAVVYLPALDKPGVYQGREIVLGPRAGDYYLVANGLEEGEQVVTHGNFKIDSSLQILAKPSMMNPEAGSGASSAPGHAHGDGASPGRDASGMPAASDVPEAFKRQVLPNLKAYDRISEAVKSKDLAAIRAAFSDFRKTLTASDVQLSNLLSGRPRMLWMELVMLMENDAVIGSGVRNVKDAERIERTLSGHVARLRVQLDLERSPPASVVVREQVPAGFKAQVAGVLDRYFSLQDALAGDDVARVKASVRDLALAVRGLDVTALDKENREVWNGFFTNLQQALGQLEQADSLPDFRKCFALLSEATTLVVDSFGIQPEFPVYQFRCSMAFEGRGAMWLQKSNEGRNPYYGEAMIGCAELIRTLFADSS